MEIKDVICVLNSISGIGTVAINKLPYDELSDVCNEADLLKLIKKIAYYNKKVLVPNQKELREKIFVAETLNINNKENNIVTLTKFDYDFPDSLRNLHNPCNIIYCKGNLALLKSKCIAIIGTRKASAEGIKVGDCLGENVCKQGFTVVSGLALGCDSAAHNGTLRANGSTIAVLGNGLHTIYPKTNTLLAKKILSNGGLLLTEYPYGTDVNNYRLVARDRIQAALSSGVIVVETKEVGGSWHAVKAAIKSNKPIACFMGYKKKQYMCNLEAFGNRRMIDMGVATSISNIEELKEFLQSTDKSYNMMDSLF